MKKQINDWDITIPTAFSDYIESEYQAGDVFPPKNEIFNALKLTPKSKTKVVIIGQDPYHTPGVANGLAFSTKADAKIPPSLRNMFKELEEDTGIHRLNPDLSDWADQGVLLLNSALTVKSGDAGSHTGKIDVNGAPYGWNDFIISIIEQLNESTDPNTPMIYVLLGKKAQWVLDYIDRNKAVTMQYGHPSPFSYQKHFKGCEMFSNINSTLKVLNQSPINWSERDIEITFDDAHGCDIGCDCCSKNITNGVVKITPSQKDRFGDTIVDYLDTNIVHSAIELEHVFEYGSTICNTCLKNNNIKGE